MALVKGDINPGKETLVRVHQPVSIMDFLNTGSSHSWSLTDAMQEIAKAERGILILLNCNEVPEDFLGRFKALGNRSENRPAPATAQTLRNYGIGAQILRDIGAGRLRLLGNPKKMPSMAGFGLDIIGYFENRNT